MGIIKTRYFVNGVEFTDYKEAERYATKIKPKFALKELISKELFDSELGVLESDLIVVANWIAQSICDDKVLLKSLLEMEDE